MCSLDGVLADCLDPTTGAQPAVGSGRGRLRRTREPARGPEPEHPRRRDASRLPLRRGRKVRPRIGPQPGKRRDCGPGRAAAPGLAGRMALGGAAFRVLRPHTRCGAGNRHLECGEIWKDRVVVQFRASGRWRPTPWAAISLSINYLEGKAHFRRSSAALTAPCLQRLDHPGVAQRVRLHPGQVQELGDAFVM
jgi:hypothetical protein